MYARRLSLRIALVGLFALSATSQTNSPTLATVYLQNTADRYQHSIDVYSDADAAGNHFAYRGEFDNNGGQGVSQVPPMDEISATAPCFSGVTCITASFDPSQLDWGGWYFMNGILGPMDRKPTANWGTIPNAGYDLTGATALQFWARGVNGGEVVHFFAFGVGNTVPPYEPYPDSSLTTLKIDPGPQTLSTTWTQYQIPLNGLDIHYVLGGFAWEALAKDQPSTSQPISFYVDDIQYLKDRLTDPHLLVSYETIKSSPPNDFDKVERNAAFVYDNAVAMIALIAAGDLAHARTIADGLLYAQANDRFFTDGRVRNAYQGGDIMLPPGWLPNNKANTVRMPGWYDPGRTTWFEDESHVSTNTGNVAWAMLALLYFYETTSEQKYLHAVDQLGDWVIENTSDNRGSGGFTGGYDGWENGADPNCASAVYVNGQCKRLYKSTEHNIDLYGAFSRLDAIEKLDKWAKAAQQAKIFVLSMWDGDPTEGGKFWTGTDEGGIAAFKQVIPVDIQAWAIQALGSRSQPYWKALDYVESHHKTAQGYGFKQNDNDQLCGDNTWFEGTSQVAVAYLLTGNSAKWQSILNGIHSEEWSSGAMPATDGQCLNTGFVLNDGQPWEYFRRAHVGATAWLSLAENGVNPYRASLYEPTFFPSGSPATQTVGAGGSANYNIALSPIGGFNQAVSLSCTVIGPPNTVLPICAFSPGSPVLDGVSTTQITLMVSTTAPMVMAGSLRSEPHNASPNFRVPSAWFVSLVLAAIFLAGVVLARLAARDVWVKTARGMTIAAVLTMTSCGGGSSGSMSPPIPQGGTLSGSYAITITISATNGSLSKQIPVTLVVQ